MVKIHERCTTNLLVSNLAESFVSLSKIKVMQPDKRRLVKQLLKGKTQKEIAEVYKVKLWKIEKLVKD